MFALATVLETVPLGGLGSDALGVGATGRNSKGAPSLHSCDMARYGQAGGGGLWWKKDTVIWSGTAAHAPLWMGNSVCLFVCLSVCMYTMSLPPLIACCTKGRDYVEGGTSCGWVNHAPSHPRSLTLSPTHTLTRSGREAHRFLRSLPPPRSSSPPSRLNLFFISSF